MSYEVFDTKVNAVLGFYDSEEEALALVRTLVGDDEAGRLWAEDLAVSHERADGSFDEPLRGGQLLAKMEVMAIPAR